jgi:hypothetical protein
VGVDEIFRGGDLLPTVTLLETQKSDLPVVAVERISELGACTAGHIPTILRVGQMEICNGLFRQFRFKYVAIAKFQFPAD